MTQVGDSQAAALMTVLELEERDTDLFVGQTPTTPLQRIFGGQVAGQALMAASNTLPEDRGVHSLHSYFLRPGDPNEEIRYAVDRIRDGRTFSTRRVIAWQRRGGKDVAIFALTADASAPEEPVAEHALPMPGVPAPETLPSLAEVVAPYGEKAAVALSISQAVEQRLLEDPFDRRPKSPPDWPAWAAAGAASTPAPASTTPCGSTTPSGPTSGSSTRPTARSPRVGARSASGRSGLPTARTWRPSRSRGSSGR
jgi:acyl-CoA thioesterase-2